MEILNMLAVIKTAKERIMANKKTWAIAMLFALVVGLAGVYARGVLLRSSQTFVGGGMTLTLNSNGSAVFTLPPQRLTGRYTLDTAGRFVVFNWDDGAHEAFPFQWAQQGQTIQWVEIAGTRLMRR